MECKATPRGFWIGDCPTPKQYDRRGLLLSRCLKKYSFEYEGCTYVGKAGDAVDAFIQANPDGLADFSVWLQNNWKEVRNV